MGREADRLRHAWRVILAISLGLLLLTSLIACASFGQKRRERAENHLNLGSAYVESGDYTTALRELLAAEKDAPNNPRVHYYLAIAYFGKGLDAAAATAAERAVALKKDYPVAHNLLGAIYFSQGRYDKAIEAFNRALDDVLYETPALTLYNLGKAYSRLGDYPRALKSYREADQRDSRRELLPLIKMETGKVSFAQGNYAEAAAGFKEATELAPTLVEAHYWLGEAYLKQGRGREARQAYETVVRLSPGSELGLKARKMLPSP
ncbi:MAG: tetratricopeptide repeat protein [Pseudomonadota bacterium]|nr:tetratricopeptide repeat protein [Pseudomonadota bacterium]